MYSKEEVIKILKSIFAFIDHGTIKIDNKVFTGHPGLYFFYSKDELSLKILEVLNKDYYDRYDIYYIGNKLIKYMLSKYDSHTKINFFNNKYIPIKFKVYDDRVYIINQSLDIDNFIGASVLEINGISIQVILKELESIICYSTNEYLLVQEEDMLRNIDILKSLPSISSNIDKLVFKVLYNNEIKEVTIDLKKEYSPIIEKKVDNYSFEIIDNIVIVHYNSCLDATGMQNLISKLKEIKDTDNYIIDLRNNSGGDSSIIKPLIEFLKDKNIVILVNERVFSSGRMAYVDLKNIGGYSIGSNISTSLNCFGNNPGSYLLKDLGLSVKRNSTYWLYDENFVCHGFEKDTFSDYFKDKRYLLEPIILQPDLYVPNTILDILNNSDLEVEAAINYFNRNKRLK